MSQTSLEKLHHIIGSTTSTEIEVIHQLKNFIYDYELENTRNKDSRTISELFEESMKELQSHNPGANSFKTGLTDLDKIGGFLKGEFVVIGGRPAMGKTQLLVNMILHISKTTPVLYFTFDLSEHVLATRFISCLSKVATENILQNNLNADDKAKVVAHGNELSNYKIFINDNYNNSISRFKAQCLKQIQENAVQIIVVDYLQMMGSNKYRYNRESEISFISRELKNIAKDNNVCVIATSQLSRAVESRGGDKKPQLSDLRESGAIEQDADKVIFLHRPEYYGLTEDASGNSTAGLMELIIAKNRNGQLGSVQLKVDSHFTTINDFQNYKTEFTYSSDRLQELNRTPGLNDIEDKPF